MADRMHISAGPDPAHRSVSTSRRFLFLQGPISPYFPEVAAGLQALGHGVHRINLSRGDALFWPMGQRLPRAVDYTGTAEEWPGFIARFLDRERITDIMLLGEQRTPHQQAIAAAKAHGAQVVVTDFGYFRPDWITLERDAMGGGSLFPRDPEEILALARGLPPADLTQRYTDDFVRQAAWDVAYHLAQMLPGRFRHYESHQLYSPIATYGGILPRIWSRRAEHAEGDRTLATAAAAGPVWLFAMQMETDFSIRAYSHYPDLITPIRETLASFARHAPRNGRLLFKIHPLDPMLRDWRRLIPAWAAEAGLDVARVAVVRHGNMDAMLTTSRGLVTVNSTVGLKGLWLGCPVLALGQAVYNVPGLTFRGGLDAFWEAGVAAEPGLLAAFLSALQAVTQLRGVFYAPEGRRQAVVATVERLHRNLVGVPVMPAGRPESA